MMICAVITFSEDVMLCFHSICLFVCLFVNRITQNWLNQFLPNLMAHEPLKNPLDFGGYPDHDTLGLGSG